MSYRWPVHLTLKLSSFSRRLHFSARTEAVAWEDWLSKEYQRWVPHLELSVHYSCCINKRKKKFILCDGIIFIDNTIPSCSKSSGGICHSENQSRCVSETSMSVRILNGCCIFSVCGIRCNRSTSYKYCHFKQYNLSTRTSELFVWTCLSANAFFQ